MIRKMQKKITRIDYIEIAPGRPDLCSEGLFEYYCSDCKYFFLCYPEALTPLDLGDDNLQRLFQYVKSLIKDEK